MPQELEPLLSPLKEEMGDKGFKHRSLFDFFVSRVQRYLHVALCMDPANEGFLLRCESNPALYMRCSMLWMGSWEVPSMERLPLQVFAGVPEEHLAAAERPALVKQMVKLHESHVPHGATPRMYALLLTTYYLLLTPPRMYAPFLSP